VATKIDALEEPERLESLRRQADSDGRLFFAVSSVTNKGIRDLISAVAAKLSELKESAKASEIVELAL
jgi:GTP-binding protein